MEAVRQFGQKFASVLLFWGNNSNCWGLDTTQFRTGEEQVIFTSGLDSEVNLQPVRRQF